MKLIHRIAYFSVGLFFGIMILIFFLGGKRVSCDYSPNDRVLKDIRNKDREISPEVLSYFEANELDTAKISQILQNGKVDFKRSNTLGDPCNSYLLFKEIQANILELQVENCDSLATFTAARLVEKK